MSGEVLEIKLAAEYRKGVKHGIKIMEKRMMLASEKRNPIDIEGRAFFVESDMDNLRAIFEELKREMDK